MSDDGSLDLRDGGTGGGPAKISYKNVSGTMGRPWSRMVGCKGWRSTRWQERHPGCIGGEAVDRDYKHWRRIWFVEGNSEF